MSRNKILTFLSTTAMVFGIESTDVSSMQEPDWPSLVPPNFATMTSLVKRKNQALARQKLARLATENTVAGRKAQEIVMRSGGATDQAVEEYESERKAPHDQGTSRVFHPAGGHTPPHGQGIGGGNPFAGYVGEDRPLPPIPEEYKEKEDQKKAGAGGESLEEQLKAEQEKRKLTEEQLKAEQEKRKTIKQKLKAEQEKREIIEEQNKEKAARDDKKAGTGGAGAPPPPSPAGAGTDGAGGARLEDQLKAAQGTLRRPGATPPPVTEHDDLFAKIKQRRKNMNPDAKKASDSGKGKEKAPDSDSEWSDSEGEE